MKYWFLVCTHVLKSDGPKQLGDFVDIIIQHKPPSIKRITELCVRKSRFILTKPETRCEADNNALLKALQYMLIWTSL
jgi:hypothetical protein